MPSKKPSKRDVTKALDRVFGKGGVDYNEYGKDSLGYYYGRVDFGGTVGSHAFGHSIHEMRAKIVDWCEAIFKARVNGALEKGREDLAKAKRIVRKAKACREP